MDKMQQTLVMKVDLLLTFRYTCKVVRCCFICLNIFFSLPFHFSIYIFACHIHQENKEGLELLKTAIAKAGYTSQVSFFLSLFLVDYPLSGDSQDCFC